VNRRGRPIDTVVNMSCLVGDGAARGVILMMDATPRDSGSPEGRGRPAAAASDGQRDAESPA
jgi:hypothetical protein